MLRLQCEKLGDDLFRYCYNRLRQVYHISHSSMYNHTDIKQVSSDEEVKEAEKDILQKLGPHRTGFLRYLQHLIFCEDSLFG